MSLVAQNIARAREHSHKVGSSDPNSQLLSSIVLDVKEQCKDLERTVTSIGCKLGSVTTTLDITKVKCEELEVQTIASMRDFNAKFNSINQQMISFEEVVTSAKEAVMGFEQGMRAMGLEFKDMASQVSNLRVNISRLDEDLGAIFTFVGDYREKTNAEIAQLKGVSL